MTVTESTPAPAKAARWTNQWKELYAEVINTGLCTGCAGCVDRLPPRRHRLRPRDGRLQAVPPRGRARPDDCIHGEKGCTSCTRACPRFRAWEPEANEHLFGRDREPDEMYGITKDILLCRASDDMVHQIGQDGGFVSALLIWAMDEGYIDCALTSFLEGDGSDAGRRMPGVARNKDEILASAGSRYTYSANTLAMKQALERGLLASSPWSA